MLTEETARLLHAYVTDEFLAGPLQIYFVRHAQFSIPLCPMTLSVCISARVWVTYSRHSDSYCCFLCEIPYFFKVPAEHVCTAPFRASDPPGFGVDSNQVEQQDSG